MASSRRDFLRAAAALSGSSLTVRAGTNAAVHKPGARAPVSGDAYQPSKSSRYRSNWGRWGPDDQKGAVNLITPAKRAAAAALVKTGRTVSLAPSFTPPQHYIRINQRGTGHSAFGLSSSWDTYSVSLGPRWRRDGRELFFLSSDMKIMTTAIPGGDAFAAEAPTPLFQTRVPLTGNPYRVNYTVTRDGQRFLVNVAVGEGLSAPLTVLSNWPALLDK